MAWPKSLGRFAVALALALACGLAPGAVAETAPRVEGFRSARLGMSFAEVEAAARADFGASQAPFGQMRQPDGNRAIVAAFSRLSPVAVPAIVSYLFDSADTLREVRIAWQLEGEPSREEREAILRSGLRLAEFLEQKYAGLNTVRPGGIGPNEMLLFGGSDAANSEIALTISGIEYEPVVLGTRQPARPATGDVVLVLNYVARQR